MENQPALRIICLTLLAWLGTLPSSFGADSLQWTVSFKGEPNRPVVLSDGRIIVGLRSLVRPRPEALADTVICLSAAGEQLWAFRTEFGISVGPTIGADDVIYFVAPLRIENKVAEQLVALNPDSSIRWFKPSAPTPTGELSVGADGTIILQGNGIYSYFDTGLLMWSTTKIKGFNSHITLSHEGKLLASTSEGDLQTETSLDRVSSARRQFDDTNAIPGKAYTYRFLARRTA